MKGNITVAKSWNELNDWQVQQIAHLYLNTPVDEFDSAYLKMIFAVFQKSPNPKNRNFLRKLVREIPVSELSKHTDWLLKTTSYYRFPEIEGLIRPTDALGDISIRQFSTIDSFFYSWNKEKNDINLKRLVASIYRINEQFYDTDLPAVDKITRSISKSKMEQIALGYMFTRMYIADKFPVIFPKKEKTEEEELKPVFKKLEEQYIPFDKTIIAMSMEELQPLGKKQDANNVRIYEFMSVLSETILHHEKNKKNAGK
ncbi:hypothetical protein [Epilithonimonas hominis]|uniref:hypothetical protein n=1 Tax=Epilithonimonas hominis TaxID=420404 RepID=UPI00289D175C|nr:hypothetical protein [Epilithonimonas hominis]